MESYFSAPNNTKYLVSSETLINPSILLNVICKGFKPIKILYQMLETKIFSFDFSSIKILSRSKSSNLIMSLI